MRRQRINSVASCVLAGAALILAALANNSAYAQVYSAPVASPVGGPVVPLDPATVSAGVRTPTRQEIDARLHQKAANEFAAAAQRRADLQQRAVALGIPKYIQAPSGGYVATLIAITPDGQPVYASPHNISGADSIGVDEVWEPGLVTGIPNWPTGGNPPNGLNLDASGVTIGMWEVEEAQGFASVQTTHDQLNGRAAQLDSTILGLSQHATGVAGTIGSEGLDAFFLLNGNSFNWGNHSRGMAHGGTLHTYDFSEFAGEFSLEAASTGGPTPGGLRLSNHSYGLNSGWQQFGGSWYWFGNGAAQQDWKFGAYMGVADGMAARELDINANDAPSSLLIYSSGNDQNQGPGALPPGGYCLPTGACGQTATRDWNDGDAGSYDTLPPSGCAKNVLTVGAVYDLVDGHLTPANNTTLAPFSSFGPTDDGRIKPDVVACGIRSGTGPRNPEGLPGFLSLYCDPANPGVNNHYAYGWTGTSFSAPTVAGGLALALQRRDQLQPGWGAADFPWPILSSTLRSLAIHNAREAGDFPGPDFRFGYGLFDAVATVDLVDADASAPFNPNGGHPRPYVKEVQLLTGLPNNYVQFNIRAVSSATPLKVTICWNDPAGPAQTLNTVDQQNVRLRNDLDLRVYPPGTQVFDPNAPSTFKPYTLNPDLTGQNPVNRAAAARTDQDDARNNVEQVVVNNPTTTGDYIVRVTHKGTLVGNQQWASVALSGSTIRAVPNFVLSPSNQGAGWVTITWPAVVAGIYKIQGSPSLFGPWTDATGDISANREDMAASVYAPQSPYYWRGIRYY